MSRENWWLDYIEGEIDPATRAQMKALLKSSAKDQDLVEGLTETKRALKESAGQAMISEDQLDDLHDRIMAGIEETEMAPQPGRLKQLRLKPEYRRLIRNSSLALAIAMSTGSGAVYISHLSPNTQWDVSRQIAHHAQENIDELEQMMNYQSETDFFVDVASQSLDHLTREQFESLLKTTKKTR